MTNHSTSQSIKRSKQSLESLFFNPSLERKCIFLKSSSDIGVIRNAGRNGARFAPRAFLSTLKKFSLNEEIKEYYFEEIEVADGPEEQEDFDRAQKNEAVRIKTALKNLPSTLPSTKVVHIGGGHDHIYPLVHALKDLFQRFIVINIDAHADTRTDKAFHSGTPFRQLEQELGQHFFLYQIGLIPYANSTSTLSPFNHGKQSILWRDEICSEKLETLFQDVEKNMTQHKTLVIFSLDADALSGTQVPGVSAVNANGLREEELMACWKRYRELPLQHETILGIYELNPLYDTLAGISMRTLASFVYKSF